MHRFILLVCILYIFLSVISSIVVKRSLRSSVFFYSHIFFSVSFLAYFTIMWNNSFEGVWDAHRQYSFGLLSSWLIFNVIIVVFLLFQSVISIFLLPVTKQSYLNCFTRIKFINIFSFAVSSIVFLWMIYGMVYGKYNFEVVKHRIYFEDLPSSFDGYTITHISDAHLGSFDNPEKVKYGIDMINEQKSDVIFFTGDLVNNKAEETFAWESIFGGLKARDGVFSVLGNHDYGDYFKWNSPEEKQNNLKKLKQSHKTMGFNLLLNQNVEIDRNGQKIYIIGVENWGKGFIKKGSLEKATYGVPSDGFKILLSHDPTHFQEKVISFKDKIHLTLSGHTHAMQFGVQVSDVFSWSPASFIYKYWSGVYREKDIYLNVNKGFGYLAFPGRVGMNPEITVIELKKK